MVVFSKKKVIKKKSVNKKNKNKNTRVKRRVSRGKSRRRVKRKYVGGVAKGNQEGTKTNPEYYTIEHNNNYDSKNLFEYIEDLVEVAYLAIVLIFLLCGPISADNKIEPAKKAVKTKLGENYPESLVNTLLVHGVKVDYKLAKGKANGGALKGGGDRWKNLKKLLRINGETIPPPPGFGDGDQAPPLPYIDISLPTLEEMKATEFDFDILKMEFIIDKISAEIATLKASQPAIENTMRNVRARVAEVSAVSDPPHNNTVTTDNAILASLRARISLNEHLIELNSSSTSPTPTPTLPDGLNAHKELVKQIAIDAVNYNFKNPRTDKIVISEGTKNEIENKELTSFFGDIKESRI